ALHKSKRKANPRLVAAIWTWGIAGSILCDSHFASQPCTKQQRGDEGSRMTTRIAYMTGEYPRATDTFIQREVGALREEGFDVHTFSVRRPHSKEAIGQEQQIEGANTTYLLPLNPISLVRSHATLLLGSPLRYFKGLWTSLTIRGEGLRAAFRNLA